MQKKGGELTWSETGFTRFCDRVKQNKMSAGECYEYGEMVEYIFLSVSKKVNVESVCIHISKIKTKVQSTRVNRDNCVFEAQLC